jgi:hypothetical protein
VTPLDYGLQKLNPVLEDELQLQALGQSDASSHRALHSPFVKQMPDWHSVPTVQRAPMSLNETSEQELFPDSGEPTDDRSPIMQTENPDACDRTHFQCRGHSFATEQRFVQT